MAARTPREVHELWARRFSAGAVDALLELYERDATLVPQPGQIAKGKSEIEQALRGFLALQGRFQLDFGEAIGAGDIALLLSRWVLTGTGPDGTPVHLGGQTSDVVRRQPDGTWLIAVDNPWGSAALPA